jgi:hypothetical protein
MKMYIVIAWNDVDEGDRKAHDSCGPYATKEEAASLAKEFADDYEHSGVYAIDVKAVEVKVTIDETPDEVAPQVGQISW